MKTKQLGFLSIFMIALIGFSCTNTKKSEESADETSGTMELKAKITLTKAPPSPEFPDARLLKIASTSTPTDSGNVVNYTFDVQNYELGVPTADYETRGIANSGKGQHIHYIVNNGPYAAHYMPGVNDILDDGNYVVLAFLSRSYHESVKSDEAYYVENLTVGDVEVDEADLSAPHLFYSRPKGTYSGADTKKVMLDFYLLNTTLSTDGNKVRATINGNEFMIDEWAPYYIEGLPMGENTIKLELIDGEGNAVLGPFNSVERTVTLEE
ncbi:phosphopeptide-binding protein [Ekhidna sp.]|uniref:phosphopeptide-binding protein n=1 Tax=Ekhidna sp. TaxID=2608089 RepID=UPI0035130459